MTFNADRISGIVFFIVGALLISWVIPVFIDSSEDSWVSPEMIPNAVAVILSCGGLLLIFQPTHIQSETRSIFLRTGFYLLILTSGLLAMSLLGFLYSAPLIALTLMLAMGERRIFWLLIGALIMPLGIWYLVSQVLERALP